jgi:hypothetical protein
MDRRTFLSRVGGLTAATAVPGMATPKETTASGAFALRQFEALRIRLEDAARNLKKPFPPHPTNGDEERYPNRIGSFTKSLPHNAIGEVEPAAYRAMLRALATGEAADFDAVPQGGTAKLGNAQAAYAFSLEGLDSHQTVLPVPPAFASAWEAGEMAEVYWQALTRDVPFSEYGSDPTVAAAAAELSGYSDFRGPKSGGAVTPGTLFRGPTPGDLAGPYISQFLWKPVPFGPDILDQRVPVPVAGSDFLVSEEAWLANQNGVPAAPVPPGGPVRYILTNRDLAAWVHRDFTYQAGLYAAQILLSLGPAALSDSNPYKTSLNQSGFVSFGAAYVVGLVGRVANEALKATWFQKWLVHRRLRPEEFAGRVHYHLLGAASYPLNPELLSKTAPGGVLDRIYSRNASRNSGAGTYLLPQSYPEGSPIFSAYPSGHAAILGACVTVLKALFLERFVLPNPVVPDATGQSLAPYVGAPLTIGGELDKLAFNIGMGRAAAGIHWRTDIDRGSILGENVALAILRGEKELYNEPVTFTITKFDGTTVTL